MNTIGTGEHSAVGLSMGLDKPATGQAFLVGPSKPRPVDHWITVTATRLWRCRRRPKKGSGNVEPINVLEMEPEA
jgi:hypothetical protein